MNNIIVDLLDILSISHESMLDCLSEREDGNIGIMVCKDEHALMYRQVKEVYDTTLEKLKDLAFGFNVE